MKKNDTLIRNYSGTFLYSKGDYEKNIFKYLNQSIEIDKNSSKFADILYDIKKRQVTASLINVLMNPNVVLLVGSGGLSMPRTFKVFTANDIRNDRSVKKVFIDVTEIFEVDAASYSCKKPDILVAYLVSAMNQLIYYSETSRIINNSAIGMSSTAAFVDMFNYVLGYLKVSSYGVVKEKLTYLIAIYYQVNLLSKSSDSESVKGLARKISKISNRDAEIVEMMYDDSDLEDINTIIKKIKELAKSAQLNTELFVDKWMYLFGSGTHFGCELYVPFATMLTDCYCGVYLNNQKAIEKAAGNNMLDFCHALFKVGSDSL